MCIYSVSDFGFPSFIFISIFHPVQYITCIYTLSVILDFRVLSLYLCFIRLAHQEVARVRLSGYCSGSMTSSLDVYALTVRIYHW